MDEDLTTGVITVRVEWTDPETAASWANDLVKLANEIVRIRALTEAQRNVDYLKQELSRTNVVGLQQVLYSLLESELNTIMLANDRKSTPSPSSILRPYQNCLHSPIAR